MLPLTGLVYLIWHPAIDQFYYEHLRRGSLLNDRVMMLYLKRWLKENGKLGRYSGYLHMNGITCSAMGSAYLNGSDAASFHKKFHSKKMMKLLRARDFGLLTPNEVISYIDSKDKSLTKFIFKTKAKKCLNAIRSTRKGC